MASPAGGERIRRILVYVVIALSMSMAAPAAHAADTFIDDDRSSHVRDIEAIAAARITHGCDRHGHRFCPGDAVTRGQMAAFLRRALDLPASDTDHFRDDDGTTFERDIDAIAAAGITYGCGAVRFCPSRRVTRGEMAALLRRALDLPASDTDHFRDDDGTTFERDIDAIAAAGITYGCGAGRYCPEGPVTRAQMASFLTRALDLPRPPPALRYQPSDEPFRFESAGIVGTPVEDRMTGVSWRPGCPVALSDLRYLRVSHVDLDGVPRLGELVVHRSVVADVRDALRRMYEAGYPIQRMRLVSDYDGDDDASMAANNTSAFNCRYIAGTTRWSNHAYGTAIDINPLRNPYVNGSHVSPADGRYYLDRSDHRPGMLVPGTAELRAWTDLGWDWGGTWSSSRDYQHLSAHGG